MIFIALSGKLACIPYQTIYSYNNTNTKPTATETILQLSFFPKLFSFSLLFQFVVKDVLIKNIQGSGNVLMSDECCKQRKNNATYGYTIPDSFISPAFTSILQMQGINEKVIMGSKLDQLDILCGSIGYIMWLIQLSRFWQTLQIVPVHAPASFQEKVAVPK